MELSTRGSAERPVVMLMKQMESHEYGERQMERLCAQD